MVLAATWLPASHIFGKDVKSPDAAMDLNCQARRRQKRTTATRAAVYYTMGLNSFWNYHSNTPDSLKFINSKKSRKF